MAVGVGESELTLVAVVAKKEDFRVLSGHQQAFDLATLSDELLMKAYQEGDFTAFSELYRRHSPRVYGYLRSKIAERNYLDDVFQAVFLKLHQSRGCYDASFPFTPWLYTVSRSVWLDHLRRAGRNLEDAADHDFLDALDHHRSQGVLDEKDGKTGESVPELSGLPDEQRRAIELRYQEELSFAEIALALKTSPANARQLVSRAVRKLRATFMKGDAK
ncbi:MAG: hypothetical protein A2X94_08535 [Bdellovibrionales bacterium GWB1_55_8]|nr:MAG: hypothetical protein A2X94_08535 [Bdellovibrionales bacterium GWB1_55_8]